MGTAEREKLFLALMIELGEAGYSETVSEGPLLEAGVSPAEFEAEFGDKDSCLFAAYDHVTELTVAAVARNWDLEEEWPQRVKLGLGALLEAIAAKPEMARAMTRAFPGIGPSAYERYVELLERLVPFVREGREYSSVDADLPREVELLAVGAAEAIIFGEVDAGRAGRLPQMMPEVLFSLLVPFMGPERAAEEMRSAAAAR
jgi:hypothetical protein